MDETTAEFITWMRTKRDAATNTIKTYTRLVNGWATFMPTPLDQRTPEDVEEFTARPRRGGGDGQAATVAHEVAVLSSFYRWAMARHHYPSNPAVLAARPKVRNRNPRPVDDDTWVQLWTSNLSDDARVALGLGFFAGLRRSEIVRLHGTHVWGRDIVHFVRKGGGEDRIDLGDLVDHWAAFMPSVLVDPDMLERPLRHLARQQGDRRLLPWNSTTPQALNGRMATWVRQAGLVSDSITPHMLRHSFATNLLRTGVPIEVACDLCNHSSIAVTMRYVKTSGGRLASLRTSSLHASDKRRDI